MLYVMDITAGLSSFSFEAGLTDGEKNFEYLRERSAELMFCGCIQATFVCELFRSLRCAVNGSTAGSSVSSKDLCVGILGFGRLGKQLLHSILENTSIKTSCIKISTRRPESAEECSRTGVDCFFDNRRLAAWADILFLCCLPSHFAKVCPDLRFHLSKCCLVYSFPSAVPVTKLAKLLEHDFILKPQYEFATWDAADVRLPSFNLTTVLTEELLTEASKPRSIKGTITLDLNWRNGRMRWSLMHTISLVHPMHLLFLQLTLFLGFHSSTLKQRRRHCWTF
ncbi:NADP-dependent oxidoreductase domain-containing protein 1 isoform X2 [Oryzias melastigma]|uniref:NADP-dependent oxidoreductase domain-containing protein 1 isoform X2 n=1 Tax=Oryzias melastigma TaxID=30732 RepID=UPI000CF7F562|nr:NADP-dependent oxidoreductase domain-containing protein 1 isoform X2 [Oryzias melastigma]